MTNARTARVRFPPWQIYELEDGYAVEDAQGRRLGTFRGKPSLTEARAAGLLTLEEARQSAFEFARLVDLLNHALDAADPDDARTAVNGGQDHHRLPEAAAPEPAPPAAAPRRHGSTAANRGRGVSTRAK